MIAQIDSLYLRTSFFKVLQRLTSYAFFEGRPLTTKGSWINPFLFGFYKLIKNSPLICSDIKPIFVIGTGRSGTTLLGVLLSMHRNVGYLNEPKALWHSICPEEDIIGSYSKYDGRYILNEYDASSAVVDAAHKLYGFYSRMVCCQRVVDKYPELVFRIPFIKFIFKDAKFIFLVRNGYDTLVSIDKWSKRKGVEKNGQREDWWGLNNRKWRLLLEQVVPQDHLLAPIASDLSNFNNHIDMAAVEWVATMNQGLKVVERYPETILQIKYEDLTTNPELSLNSILNFCSLPEDPVFMRYALSRVHPSVSHERVEIAEVLRPAFEDVMSRLGYD